MKINKNLLYVGGAVVALLYFALQSGYNPLKGSGEIGEIVSPQAYEELLKQKSSDGKRVAIIARGSISNSDISMRIGAPVDIIFSGLDAKASAIGLFPIPFGKDDNNSCYIPSEFTPEDLVLYDNEGNALPYGEAVTLSFTLERISNAIPEKDEKTGKYAWRHKQIRIDPIK